MRFKMLATFLLVGCGGVYVGDVYEEPLTQKRIVIEGVGSCDELHEEHQDLRAERVFVVNNTPGEADCVLTKSIGGTGDVTLVFYDAMSKEELNKNFRPLD